MNGPEHYCAAEARLSASDYQRQEGDMEGAMHEAAVAQVHATLALTAATVASGLVGEWFDLEQEATEWLKTTQPTTPRRRAAVAEVDGG